MNITMRIYRLHDLDLMYLYKMPGVSIQKIIKVVLKSYVKDRNSINGIRERVDIPRIIHDKNIPQSALIHIYLNEGEDDEVIEWINQVPKGLRNSLLKNILRGYVNFPITIPYETEVTTETTEHKGSHNHMGRLNDSLKNTKAKKPTKPKEKPVDDKPVSDKVLEAPLPSTETKKNVITEEGDNVLNNDIEKSKPQNNTPKTATKVTEDVTDDTDGDLFDDFESMMKDF